jgi:hypothetical protein
MAGQYLTKSRFKIGVECPTKLFYLDDKSYGNLNSENSFLQSLAEGGFQVGELAKLYYPNGVEITITDKDKAALQTLELLKQDNVVIYEASFKHQNLFVKTDVVVKKGNSIELIEVKAKSFDPTQEEQFYTKRSKNGKAKLNSTWEPYLVDVAFQTYVAKKVLPNINITSSMMFADKSAKASVDGLNQRFFLEKGKDGRTKVNVAEGTTIETLGDKILVKVVVDSEVKLVWEMIFNNGMSFEQTVNYLSDICKQHEFSKPVVGNHCKSCEFRIGCKQKESGLKSGFENCWSVAAGLKQSDFEKPFVFDIWNFRKSASLIEEGKYFVDQLDEEDVSPASKNGEVGLSNSERQWLQVEKIHKNDQKPFIDIQGLQREMKSWIFPLHFIDFETTMVAVPFNKGRRPYEQIAFQFSHHVVHKNGKIVHQDEYINRKKGHFPNFDFVRALKTALEKDEGTVFRYAAHENTVLCQIRQQLLSSVNNIADRDDLVRFIETITSGGDSVKEWTGSRNMVDLCDLVKRYFYHPLTGGSNSIKKVLPAILHESKYLQRKYNNPIYGTDEIVSKNFKNWSWISFDLNRKVVDPYKMLPPIFSDIDLEQMDSLITDGNIADGGAAMTSYARMQFTQMSESESEIVANALLKYCELDTFAMVMIFEYWKHEIENSAREAA